MATAAAERLEKVRSISLFRIHAHAPRPWQRFYLAARHRSSAHGYELKFCKLKSSIAGPASGFMFA
jgi:hypothetical protein